MTFPKLPGSYKIIQDRYIYLLARGKVEFSFIFWGTFTTFATKIDSYVTIHNTNYLVYWIWSITYTLESKWFPPKWNIHVSSFRRNKLSSVHVEDFHATGIACTRDLSRWSAFAGRAFSTLDGKNVVCAVDTFGQAWNLKTTCPRSITYVRRRHGINTWVHGSRRLFLLSLFNN